MEIPKTLKIGGFTWTIEEHQDVAREGNIFGSTHQTSQKFFLEPNLSIQKQQQTILHEILHAVWWQSGLGRIWDGPDKSKDEERIIHALSMGLYQVLRDNDLTFK